MEKLLTLSVLFVPVALAIMSSSRPDPEEAVRWLIKRVVLFFIVWAVVGTRLYFYL